MKVKRDRGPVKYVVQDEQDDNGNPIDGASTFVLRPDNKETQMLVEELGKRSEDAGFSWSWEYLKLSLMDVIGLVDEDGVMLDMDRDPDGRPTDAFLELIPMRYRMEIATEFMGHFNLTEQDRKN
jgi:hypothetical protein